MTSPLVLVTSSTPSSTPTAAVPSLPPTASTFLSSLCAQSFGSDVTLLATKHDTRDATPIVATATTVVAAVTPVALPPPPAAAASTIAIPAHKLILAASSTVFYQLFYPSSTPASSTSTPPSSSILVASPAIPSSSSSSGDTKELRCTDSVVDLSEYSEHVIRLMLSCIYTDHISIDIPSSLIHSCISLATRLHVDRLREVCVRKFTAAALTPSSVCGIYDAALSLFPRHNHDETKSLMSEPKRRSGAEIAAARARLQQPVAMSFPSPSSTGLSLSSSTISVEGTASSPSSSSSTPLLNCIASTTSTYVGAFADLRFSGRYRRQTFSVRVGPVPGPNFCVGVAPVGCKTPAWSSSGYVFCAYDGGSLWHRGRQQRSYATPMVNDDIVEVIIERTAPYGTPRLSFAINGVNHGDSGYDDIPTTELVPCVDLGNRGDTITLLHATQLLFDDDDGLDLMETKEQKTAKSSDGIDGVISFICTNISSIITDPSWLALSTVGLETLLRHDELAIDEIDLYNGVMRWADARLALDATTTVTTPSLRRAALGDIFTYIRFPLMNIETLSSTITTSGLLTSDEMLSLYLYQGDRSAIPTGWYHGTIPRAPSLVAWTWDPMMSMTITCDTTRTRLTCSNSQGWIHGSVGWNKGRHAWQVTVNAFTGSWFCFAVAARTPINRVDSWRDPSFWGWSNVSFAYRGANQTPEPTDWLPSHVIHCVLDLDASSRSFTVLNVTTGRSVRMDGLPAHPLANHQWTPHINILGACTMTLLPIPLSSVGTIVKK